MLLPLERGRGRGVLDSKGPGTARGLLTYPKTSRFCQFITDAEARYGALCYVGGTAQQHATARRAQAEAQADWRFDDASRQRKEDAQQGPFVGHGAG